MIVDNHGELKINTCGLNRYMAEMVKPEKCIRRRDFFNGEYIPAKMCDNCFLSSGDLCIYEIIEVEYVDGSYIPDYDKTRKCYFSQFCCPNCGELIKQDSYYWIWWTAGNGHPDIKCENCNTEYYCIGEDDQTNKLMLVRKPVVFYD
jgi:hypothetical protein